MLPCPARTSAARPAPPRRDTVARSTWHIQGSTPVYAQYIQLKRVESMDKTRPPRLHSSIRPTTPSRRPKVSRPRFSQRPTPKQELTSPPPTRDQSRPATRPTLPSASRTLTPRGWSPFVSTSLIDPSTVRPVGWSSLRMILTRVPTWRARWGGGFPCPVGPREELVEEEKEGGVGGDGARGGGCVPRREAGVQSFPWRGSRGEPLPPPCQCEFVGHLTSSKHQSEAASTSPANSWSANLAF